MSLTDGHTWTENNRIGALENKFLTVDQLGQRKGVLIPISTALVMVRAVAI